jgi:hypothetical protein
MEIHADVRLLVALLVPLVAAHAGSPDSDALVSKYENKFAVVLKDGINTCLHRSTGEEMARAMGGIQPSGLPEGGSMSSMIIDQNGRAVYWPGNSLQQALQNCQLDPLHKGEIVKLIHVGVGYGYLHLQLKTTSPHTDTRGVGAFEHHELHGGDVMLTIMPDQVPVVGKRFHKGPGVKSPEDRAAIEALVGGWLALFDTAEAAQTAQIGNTASGIYVRQVKAGMSFAEVEAALGPPETRVDLGEKVLYKYKDMTTVEFHDGKVTDVR